MNRLRMKLLARRLESALHDAGLAWECKANAARLFAHDVDGPPLDCCEAYLSDDGQTILVLLRCGSQCRQRFRVDCLDAAARFVAEHQCPGLTNAKIQRKRSVKV